MPDTNPKTFRSSRGFSLIELLIVLTIVGILTAIAIPVMITQRRLYRSTAMTREVLTRLRNARQLAISTRQSITFQYDDSTKAINIINHHNNENNNPALPHYFPPSCTLSRTLILVAPGYPVTSCSTGEGIIDYLPSPPKPYPLTQGGLTAAEIIYGIPAGSPPLPAGAPVIPVTMLDDTIVMTPLIPVGAGGKLNITFQADGSVVDAAGLPLNRALYFFNNLAAQSTASAISVVGASGRAKVWRYNQGGNNFIE